MQLKDRNPDLQFFLSCDIERKEGEGGGGVKASSCVPQAVDVCFQSDLRLSG